MMKNNSVKKSQQEQKDGLLKRVFRSREIGIFLVLIIICIVLAFVTPRFVMLSNLTNVARQMAVIAIIAVGTTYVIITAGIDLSVGSTVAFAGCITALFLVNGYPIWQCIAIGLLLGTIVGLVNGFLIVYIKLAPFIATLGTMGIARGLVLALTRGYPIQPFPSDFEFIGRGYLGPFPVPVVIMVVIVIMGQILLTKTKFGRYIYYIGSNPTAARLSGLNVNLTILLVYTIAGFLAGLSSILLISRLTSAQSNMGSDFALDAIAAVVIGGSSLSGGEGSVIGSLIGTALMGIIRNALILLGVNVYWQSVVIGLVIVIAVSLDAFRQKKVEINIMDFFKNLNTTTKEKSKAEVKKKVLIWVVLILFVVILLITLNINKNKSEGLVPSVDKETIGPTTMPVQVDQEKLFSNKDAVNVCDNELLIKEILLGESDKEKLDLIIIDLDIKNNSGKQVPINSFDFTIVDGSGGIHTDIAGGKFETALGSIRLEPGLTASGQIAFYIPKGDTQSRLIWQPGWCTGVIYVELFE